MSQFRFPLVSTAGLSLVNVLKTELMDEYFFEWVDALANREIQIGEMKSNEADSIRMDPSGSLIDAENVYW